MLNGARFAMTQARHTGFARLTQKEVSQAAARHEMLYSGRVGGARASFAFCDLSGLDLSGRNLADADFTGAVMEETNLAGDAAGFRQFLRRRSAPLQSQGRQPPARRPARRLAARRQPDRRRSL